MYPEKKYERVYFALKRLDDEHYPYLSELRNDEYKLTVNGFTNSVRHALLVSEESADNIIKQIPGLHKINVRTTIEELFHAMPTVQG